MQQAKVRLGGRDYTIAALPIGASKEWRERLNGPFADLVTILTRASTLELHQFGDMAGLLTQFSGVLIGSIDLVLELLYAYAPNVAEDREWLRDNAYDQEVIDAFGEVLKLAFPFGVLLEMVTGRMGSKTSSSLPSPNGVLPLPQSGPVSKRKK